MNDIVLKGLPWKHRKLVRTESFQVEKDRHSTEGMGPCGECSPFLSSSEKDVCAILTGEEIGVVVYAIKSVKEMIIAIKCAIGGVF